MKKVKQTILNILTLGSYKRRKRPTKFENYIKDLRELTLNYQTKELQKDHKNPLNKDLHSKVAYYQFTCQ